MPADYAGACAAIKTKFLDEWEGTPAAAVGFVNEADPLMASTTTGAPIPWVLFEIVSNDSDKVGLGTPGNSVTVYYGLIKAHIFTPSGDGVETGMALALEAGEIFRNQLFYDDVTPGRFVRSGYTLDGQPRISEGDTYSEDGSWFNTTATIPFEFWDRR